MRLSLCPRNYRRFISSVFAGFLGSFIFFITLHIFHSISIVIKTSNTEYRRRPECTCSRVELPSLSSYFISSHTQQQKSFCSDYATQRGHHQRIISISLFGPKEVKKFEFHRTLHYLHLLIKDANIIYSNGFIYYVFTMMIQLI
jgi:hypothetical protein